MDDFVEYKIYNTHFLNVSCNSKNTKSEFIQFGESLINDINKLSANYLWREDCFYIEPKFIQNTVGARINKKGSSDLSHWKGTMYYGADINDEWFVVHLLYEISKIHQNIVIEITDNDGQFLLIHSAYNLPQWIDPNNADNRVYIHQNKLHLIPLRYDIKQNKAKCIDLILNKTVNTLGNDDLQQSIADKLNQFSHKIHENPGINYHSSVVVLPKQCANMIHKHPLIISHIVDCFVNDDTTIANYKNKIKMKQKRKFELDYNNYVFVSVRFTRYLYGMLSCKSLKSAPMYYRKNKFDFKQYINRSKCPKSVIKNAFLNGIKLMIGFELFYAKCEYNIGNQETNREWIQFKKSLIKKGYFGDCIASSDSYKGKMKNAEIYYDANMKQNEENIFCIKNGVHSNKLSQFCLNAMDVNYDDSDGNGDWIKVYHDNNEDIVALNALKHDDEKWMNITDKDLNEILNEYTDINDETKQQMLFEEIMNDEENDEVSLQTKDDILLLKENLNTFLEKKSSLHGVEVENEENVDGIQIDAERVLDILEKEKEMKSDKEFHAMKNMMEAMDHELSEKQRNNAKQPKNDDEDEDNEEEEMDIDLNVVNDILQSHITNITAQTNDSGLGPAATLLSQIGLQLK